MNKLLNIKCSHCGKLDSPTLSISGPHVKASCRHCLMYIKFVNNRELPSFRLLRATIWHEIDGDLKSISMLKDTIKFKENRQGLVRYIEYWRLYIALIKQLELYSQ